MLGNFRVTFGQFLENLRKSSESGGVKSSENQQHYQYVDKINKIIHGRL